MLIIIILAIIGTFFVYFKLKAALSSLPLSPFKEEEREVEAETNLDLNIHEEDKPTIAEISAPDDMNLSYNNSFKA